MDANNGRICPWRFEEIEWVVIELGPTGPSLAKLYRKLKSANTGHIRNPPAFCKVGLP